MTSLALKSLCWPYPYLIRNVPSQPGSELSPTSPDYDEQHGPSTGVSAYSHHYHLLLQAKRWLPRPSAKPSLLDFWAKHDDGLREPHLRHLLLK